MMKYMLFFLAMLSVCCQARKPVNTPDLALAPPALVLDHIYLMVPDKGIQSMQLLADLGFVINPRVFHITGEGKSSRIILLENAYLEILYVDDSVSYTSEKALNLSKKKTWFSGNEVSPFGVAFRRAPGVGDSIPIPNRASPPEPAGSWAKEGSFFNDITDEDDTLSTYLFVIPPYMGFDQWGPIQKDKSPALFAHANGVVQLTNAVFYGPAQAIPRKESYLRNISMLSFIKHTENYAELEFDNGRQQQTKDLRPMLPLVLKY